VLPWDLCERLLGHALPTVARTYDTGSYLEQRRDALEKWAAYLERIAGAGAPGPRESTQGQGFGSSQPTATIASARGRELNPPVEFVVP
jgi:hypothetical protein